MYFKSFVLAWRKSWAPEPLTENVPLPTESHAAYVMQIQSMIGNLGGIRMHCKLIEIVSAHNPGS